MYNKTGTQILKTTVVVLVLILVSLICLSISASASEDNEVLVNGSGMYLTTGDSWLFYQGYELVFKGLSLSQGGDKVWMELLLNSESVDDKIIREGEYFVYARNSNEIFNITVDTIYAGSDGGLVTFKPVWQYLDPTLPEPDITQNPGLVDKLNGSLNNSNSSTGDKIENTAGFDAVLFFLCMSAAAIFKTNQKR
ncbi:MAG: hypothetical protein K0A90_08555 [Methanosarcinaceae archaeon]|nr:hypothetical protein [Methanosarcinaceae archaeon]